MDAFAHLKVIGYSQAASGLLQAVGIAAGEKGIVALDGGVGQFIAAAKAGRIWEREKEVRQVH